MKGFVITILSVSIIMLIVVLSMSLRNSQLSTERSLAEPMPLVYSSFLVDNAALELNSIIGPYLSFSQRNDSTHIIISDTLSSYNYSNEIFSFDTYLTSEIASRTASNITTNYTNITSGTNRVFIDQDYIYTKDYNSRMSLFTKSGSTSAIAYNLNYTLPALRSSVSHMVLHNNATLNITILYTDLNGTGVEQGSIYPYETTALTVSYVNGCNVIITAGIISGNNGSFQIKGTNCLLSPTYEVILPPINESKKLGFDYDATIDYVQGKVRKTTLIGK